MKGLVQFFRSINVFLVYFLDGDSLTIKVVFSSDFFGVTTFEYKELWNFFTKIDNVKSQFFIY